MIVNEDIKKQALEEELSGLKRNADDPRRLVDDDEPPVPQSSTTVSSSTVMTLRNARYGYHRGQK
jgi:hypothetical protein